VLEIVSTESALSTALYLPMPDASPSNADSLNWSWKSNL